MRLIVLLKPTGKRGTKTAYTKFRKELVKDGFECLTKDLFVRVAPNRKAVKKHRNRMAQHLPDTGSIVSFSMTEMQWNKIEYLVGDKSYQEKVIGSKCHIQL